MHVFIKCATSHYHYGAVFYLYGSMGELSVEIIANGRICQIPQLTFQHPLYNSYISSDNFCPSSLIPFFIMAGAQHLQLLWFSRSQCISIYLETLFTIPVLRGWVDPRAEGHPTWYQIVLLELSYFVVVNLKIKIYVWIIMFICIGTPNLIILRCY
jgi:hypothetical protein